LEPQEIINKTLEVYKKCKIKNFPIDCIEIITNLCIPLYKYSDLSEPKVRKCLQVSNDAFTLQGVIFYNDHFPHKDRQRFSLMHEVGHIVLGHTGTCEENEKEADLFASHILVPRAIMHHLDCYSVKEVCSTFDVSCMAANRIVNEYKTYSPGENLNQHKNICDWFLPRNLYTTPIQSKLEPECNEENFTFFDTRRFLIGEVCIFEHSEHYHLHGYNS
jgi:hypothetical protein